MYHFITKQRLWLLSSVSGSAPPCPPGRSGHPVCVRAEGKTIMSVLYSIFKSTIHTAKKQRLSWSIGLARAQTPLWWVRQVCRLFGGFVCGSFSVLEVPAGTLTAIPNKTQILGYSVLLFLREEISMKRARLRDSRTQMKVQKFTPIVTDGVRTVHIMYFKLF